GWWPHLDTDFARALTRGSAGHERGFELLTKSGRLTLRTMLHLPRGKATLTLASDATIAATLLGEAGPGGPEKVELEAESTGGPTDLEVTVPPGLGGKAPALHVSYHTDADPTERPLPLSRFRPFWAPTRSPAATAPPAPPPALAGGDP